ncbi:Glucosamine-6-phosphate deaminase [Actinomycetales bacterium JB111]|nr:Glucosamine-6-phosphate deaminase [Actinomycetales bacterium JB111]
MDVIVVPDADRAGIVAAEVVADELAAAGRRRDEDGSRPVLGVATGSSPLDAYRHVAELARLGRVDLAGVSAFALDEYIGLPADHPESYHEVVDRTVRVPLGLPPDAVHVPDTGTSDHDAAAAAYDRAIADAGGIDVQILGIGANGHIGFNEPGTPLDSRTHVVELAERTRSDNARFFGSIDDVPTLAITQGLGTIGDSLCAVLIATGVAKAEAIAAMVAGPVDPRCPASSLQLHGRVTVVLDDAAASRLDAGRVRRG